MPPQPSSPERGKRLRVSASLKWPSLRLISAWQVLYMALRGPANLLVLLNQRCYDGSDDGASGPLPRRRPGGAGRVAGSGGGHRDQRQGHVPTAVAGGPHL